MKKNYMRPELEVTWVKIEECFLTSNLDLTTTSVDTPYWDED